MSIIRMKKMALIGLDTAKEDLISDLMEAGVVQITDQSKMLSEDETWAGFLQKDGSEAEIVRLEQEINRVGIALETLENYSVAKRPLFKTRRAMKRADFAKTLEGKAKIEKDIDRVLDLNDELHRLRETINQKESEIIALTPWVAYDVPLEVDRTQRTIFELGVIPATADMDALAQRVYDGRDAVELKEVGRDKDLIYVIAVAMKEEEEEVLNILKQHGYTATPFKDYSGYAKDNRIRILNELDKAKANS